MDYNNKSVERVFDIMKAISKKPQKPAELVETLQLNKSTIHRFISTLLDLGYIEKLPDHSLRLSQSFINLGINAQNHYEVVNIARPYLSQLAELFQESSLLALFNGYESEYVEKVESPHAVRTVFEPGKKAPAYAVASGKVFLSRLNEDELHEVIDHLDVQRHTENTIVNKNELKKEITNVKKNGYAVDNEEYEIGLRGFASPIRDQSGNIIAAICIAGIAPRTTGEEIVQNIITSIVETSKEISWKLGYEEKEKPSDVIPK